MSACDACLRRTWLVARLAAHVERARHERRRLGELLALGNHELIAGVAGTQAGAVARELERFDPRLARAALDGAHLTAVCRHDDAYPERLDDLVDAPAVLHVAGDPARLAELCGGDDAPAVAIVGARRASADGLEVARALGRGLAAAGVTVISGMALGVDSAAHAGALEGGGPTLAVLAGGAELPYPASKAHLYRAILAAGHCAVSEMPPGFRPFKWCFPARNRTIAALAQVTVVVEAAERSGSLITADLAQQLGRTVAVVPGRVTAPGCAGTNALLREGAQVVRHAQDALDEVLGIGVARMLPPGTGPGDDLPEDLRTVLHDVAGGRDRVDMLARTPEHAELVVAQLSELELLGYLRRLPGGRWARAL